MRTTSQVPSKEYKHGSLAEFLQAYNLDHLVPALAKNNITTYVGLTQRFSSQYHRRTSLIANPYAYSESIAADPDPSLDSEEIPEANPEANPSEGNQSAENSDGPEIIEDLYDLDYELKGLNDDDIFALCSCLETSVALQVSGVSPNAPWLFDFASKNGTIGSLKNSKWEEIEGHLLGVPEADKRIVSRVWADGDDSRESIIEQQLPPSLADILAPLGGELHNLKPQQLAKLLNGHVDADVAKGVINCAEKSREKKERLEWEQEMAAQAERVALMSERLNFTVADNMAAASAALKPGKWEHDSAKFQAGVQQKLLNAMSELGGSYDYDEQLTESMLVSKVGAGRALYGISFFEEKGGKLQHADYIKVPPRPLLEGSDFLELKLPSLPFSCKTFTHESLSATSSFEKSIDSSGFTVAAEVSGSFGGFSASASAGKSKRETSQQGKDKQEMEASLVKSFMYFVPLKSFRIPKTQMKLSEEAKADLATIEKSNNYGHALQFLKHYGSHISGETQHVGGIFMQNIEVVSKSATSKSTMERIASEAYQMNIQSGYKSFVGTKVSASVSGDMDKTKGESAGALAEKTQSSTTILTTCFGPTAQTPEEFIDKLSFNSSWFIVDRGSIDALIPVWELMDEFPNACLLIEKVWCSISMASGGHARQLEQGRRQLLAFDIILKNAPQYELGDCVGGLETTPLGHYQCFERGVISYVNNEVIVLKGRLFAHWEAHRTTLGLPISQEQISGASCVQLFEHGKASYDINVPDDVSFVSAALRYRTSALVPTGPCLISFADYKSSCDVLSFTDGKVQLCDTAAKFDDGQGWVITKVHGGQYAISPYNKQTFLLSENGNVVVGQSSSPYVLFQEYEGGYRIFLQDTTWKMLVCNDAKQLVLIAVDGEVKSNWKSVWELWPISGAYSAGKREDSVFAGAYPLPAPNPPRNSMVWYVNTAILQNEVFGRGDFELKMQDDGNFVAYVSGTSFWASNTWSCGVKLDNQYKAVLTPKGILLYNNLTGSKRSSAVIDAMRFKTMAEVHCMEFRVHDLVGTTVLEMKILDRTGGELYSEHINKPNKK